MRYSMLDWSHLGKIFGIQIAGCWVTQGLHLLNKSSWIELHMPVWHTLDFQQPGEMKILALQILKKNILKINKYVFIKIQLEITLTKFCCLSLDQKILLTYWGNYIKHLQKLNFTLNKPPY